MRSEGLGSKINWMHMGEGSNLSKVVLDGVTFCEAVLIGVDGQPGIAIHNTDGSTEYVRYSNARNRDSEMLRLKQVLELRGKERAMDPIEEIREKGAKYLPESSTIKTMTYEPLGKVLLVDFKSGGSYLYHAVPLETWEQLLKAESAGKAFHELIKKGEYAFQKVEATAAEEGVAL